MKLAGVFCDNMVLQAGKPARVFGKGDGEGVISFLNKNYPVKSSDGKFEVMLDAAPYGGPYELTAVLNGEKTVIKNVMVGEVLLLAGQSNPQWQVLDANGNLSVKPVANDKLRVYETTRLERGNDFTADDGWVVCTADTVERWSQIAYYTARLINERLGCAVGVICTYQGASNIHTWIPRERTLEPDLMIDEQCLYSVNFPVAFTWNSPGTCYAYQFKKIAGYTVSRVIWYQGESSAYDVPSRIYDKLLKALVEEWRKDMKENLQFVIVQIHDFAPLEGDRIDAWKRVQEAQERAPEYIKNTVAIKSADVSERDTIHPVDKYQLCKRIFETLYILR